MVVFFGALNTLFSGFAFGAIFYTILVQMEELRLQRLEFEYQHRESKINRMTIMIYRQIGLCSDRLSGFQIKTPDKTDLVGRQGITWILNELLTVPFSRTEISKQSLSKEFLGKFILWFDCNKAEITRLTDTVHNSCLVLQFMFQNKDEVSIISLEDLDELKTLFFANLGLEIDNFFVKMEIVLTQLESERPIGGLLKQIKGINKYQVYSYTYIDGISSGVSQLITK